jgi:hypothetical protein
MRHHRGSLLVAHVDALHPEVETSASGAAGGSAHHEENSINAFPLERLCDYFFAS